MKFIIEVDVEATDGTLGMSVESVTRMLQSLIDNYPPEAEIASMFSHTLNYAVLCEERNRKDVRAPITARMVLSKDVFDSASYREKMQDSGSLLGTATVAYAGIKKISD